LPHRAHHSFPTRRSSDLYGKASFDEVADAVADGVAAFYMRALTTRVAEPAGYVFGTARRVLAKSAERHRAIETLDDEHELVSGEDRKSTRLNSSHLGISY